MSVNPATMGRPTLDAHTRPSRIARPYEQIVHQIEEQIRQGQLPTERQLTVNFGISCGAVREAVKMLSAMGLVQARQGSSIHVCVGLVLGISRALTLSVQPDAASALDLLAFHEPIEARAAECAARRRTKADHVAIRGWVDAGDAAAAAEDFAAFALAQHAPGNGV